MTGWNLPPGVNVSDIPGNRPEDIIWEREAEKFCDNCHMSVKCKDSIGDCERSKEFSKYFRAILEEGEEREQE